MEPASKTRSDAAPSSRSSGRRQRSVSDENCPAGVRPEGGAMTAAHTVECAVYKAGTVYRAVCFDLGLFVQRPKAEDAVRELHQMISGYVQDARDAGLTWEDTLRPISRQERRYVIGRVLVGLLGQWLRDFVGELRPIASHSSVGFCQVPV